MENHPARFAPVLTAASESEIRSDVTLRGKLVLGSAGGMTVSWAPFDYVNQAARIVLVGITPGRQQATNALIEMRRALASGASLDAALLSAKTTASFSGPMRANLVAMLDHIGVDRHLSIAGCASLFGPNASLVHYTSALRYPVFVDGENYSGQPPMTRHPLLRSQLQDYLAAEVRTLPGALWVPLGPAPTEALLMLAKEGVLDRKRILDGLPHPSGANAERIAYFRGLKARELLSAKTSPRKIDEAKASLLARLADHAA